jgi:hypothetical protein
MKNIIALEEAAMFLLCLYGLYYLNVEWWVYPLLIIGPDISLVGYMANPTAGALAYNLFHHKAIAVIIFMAGMYQGNNALLETMGIILFGHSSMDRMMGYGLKLNRGFKYTHLGVIGGKKPH